MTIVLIVPICNLSFSKNLKFDMKYIHKYDYSYTPIVVFASENSIEVEKLTRRGSFLSIKEHEKIVKNIILVNHFEKSMQINNCHIYSVCFCYNYIKSFWWNMKIQNHIIQTHGIIPSFILNQKGGKCFQMWEDL